ncbi:MAG TPA: hypothetical protein VIN63_02320 [Candidatus Limnocylindria bacterium]
MTDHPFIEAHVETPQLGATWKGTEFLRRGHVSRWLPERAN